MRKASCDLLWTVLHAQQIHSLHPNNWRDANGIAATNAANLRLFGTKAPPASVANERSPDSRFVATKAFSYFGNGQ
jgi:hypothetical protein